MKTQKFRYLTDGANARTIYSTEFSVRLRAHLQFGTIFDRRWDKKPNTKTNKQRRGKVKRQQNSKKDTNVYPTSSNSYTVHRSSLADDGGRVSVIKSVTCA